MKRLHFLATGSELLSGFVLESNANWLQNQLRGFDALMERVTILPDDFDKVVEAIVEESFRCDVLVVCGGLGPTDDDLTREAIAEACGAPLVHNEDAWQMVRSFFAQRGREPSPSNRKQALVPAGGAWLSNTCGTAPGISMQKETCQILVFPGVPVEFKTMVYSELLPQLKPQPVGPLFKLWGIGESDLVDLVRQSQTFPKDCEWGTIARPEGITVHLSHSFWQRSDQDTILNNIRRDLAEYHYTEVNATPLELLAEQLKARHWKMACAESCTGGLFSEWVTNQSGCSEYFEGSVVSYSNNIKEKVLNVSASLLQKHGAVSEEVALAMAQGVLNLFGVDLAVAITGIAGPSGGRPEKPVGTVCMAVVTKDGQQTVTKKLLTGQRAMVREKSVHTTAMLALNLLKTHG